MYMVLMPFSDELHLINLEAPPHPSKYGSTFENLILNITTRVPSIAHAPVLELK
jgi:hypothetical protein